MTAAWLALLRLARRDASRRPGRTALAALLIALPVAGVVAAFTLLLTLLPTAAELARAQLGGADLAAYASGSTATDLETLLPPGSRVEPLWRGEATAGNRAVEAVGTALEGLGAGMFDIVTGRPPARPDEVAPTTGLAERLGAGVGATIDAGMGTATVVGIVRDPLRLDRETLVVGPDPDREPPAYLVSLPAGTDATTVAGRIESGGWDATSRADTSFTDPDRFLLVLVMGGFGFVVAGMVAAAAFAVSAQRRRHDLALLAASGADDRHLRRSVLSSAFVAGLAGSAAGVLLGVLLPAALLPWLEPWANRTVDGLAVSPWLLGTAAAVGVATAMAASWLTARAAGRTPVAAALTNRRPPRTSSVRLLAAGAAAIGAGVACIAVIGAAGGAEVVTALGLLTGTGLTMAGLGALSPWLVEQVTRVLARRVPVGVRFALRDTARYRSRTGPIVMAMVSGLGLSIAVGTALDTVETGMARSYRPQLGADQVLVDGPAPVPVIGELEGILDIDVTAPFTIVAPADFTSPRPLPEVVTVADGRLLQALGAPSRAAAALDAGQVVVLTGPQGDAGLSDLAATIAPGDVTEIELPLVPRAVPPIVLSWETFERSGAEQARGIPRWILALADPPDAGLMEEARAVATRLGHRLTVESGPATLDSPAIQRIALVGAGVLSLLIVAAGLALLGAETGDDEAVLVAVGADPRTRKALAAARAGVLTLLGGLLAVPAGVLPVWGLSMATRGGAVGASSLTIPWDTALSVTLAVPLVAATGAWLLTRSGRGTLPARAP